MAKKSMIARKNKRVRLQQKYLDKRMALKEAIKKCDTFEEAIELETKLQKLPVNSSRTRLVRRCEQCGRPKGVFRKFNLCRICLRNNLMRGNIPGGKKASW